MLGYPWKLHERFSGKPAASGRGFRDPLGFHRAMYNVLSVKVRDVSYSYLDGLWDLLHGISFFCCVNASAGLPDLRI